MNISIKAEAIKKSKKSYVFHCQFYFYSTNSGIINKDIICFRHSPENPDLLTTLGLLYMQVQ